jgi:putative CocE/NonD family hydrolase
MVFCGPFARFVTSFSTLLLLVAAFMQAQGAVARDQKHPFSNSSQVVTLQSSDNIKLTGRIYRPDAERYPGPRPVVIAINPWSVPATLYFKQALGLTERGFMVLAYNARGFGTSEGTIGGADERDVADAREWIDWLTQDPQIDDEKIGMMGISLGAGISLLTAAADERVKAVVSMSGWADFFRAMNENETAPLVWGNLLLASGKLLGRMGPELQQTMHDVIHYRMPRDEMQRWADRRSPMKHLMEYNRRKLPIYLQHSIEDYLFPANQIIDFYNQLTGEKKLDLTLGIHTGHEMLGLIGFNDASWQKAGDWLTQQLQPDIQWERTAEPPIHVAVKFSRKQLGFDSWPEEFSPFAFAGTSPMQLAIRPRSKFGEMTSEPLRGTYLAEKTIDSGKRSGVGTGIPILSSALEAHFKVPISQFTGLMSSKKAIMFETTPMKADTMLLGTPRVSLWAASTHDKMQLIAYLYSVSSWGHAVLLSHGPITVHAAEPGVPQQLTWDLMMTSVEVPKGSRLLLALDTHDPHYADPTSAPYQVKFKFGSAFPATMSLPLR